MTLEFSDKGIPILTMEEKLGALEYCTHEESWEDVAGHLCDLLEYSRKKIIEQVKLEGGNLTSELGSLRGMVGYYGSNPTLIKE